MISHPPSRPAAGGLLLPVAAAPVRAGFPSPADDYLDDAISLDSYLISDPAATFLVRVRGDSMATDIALLKFTTKHLDILTFSMLAC